MKGILKSTTAGWFVWYNTKKDEITSGYDSIPLHPYEKVDDSFRDKEVEFKIVYYWETGMEEPFKVANLVKAYPYLKGTMNLCEDIIEKKTGKMTEEERDSKKIPAPDELQQELRRVRVVKTAHVRAQRYTLAAIYREAEKEIESLILNQINKAK
jgi:hypothetical protein